MLYQSGMLCRAIIFNVTALFFLTTSALACPDIDGVLDLNCDQKLTIITFGDSITHGTRDELGLGYPGRLRQILPHATIYNFGVPGETTPTGRARAPIKFATVANPDFIILLEGVNDYYIETRSYLSTRDNLLSMRFSANNTRAITLLARLTYTSRTDQLAWVNGVNSAIAAFTKLNFYGLGKSILGFDKLHPTGAGYQQMAELAHTILVQQTAANRPVDTDHDGVYDFAERRAGVTPGTSAGHSDPNDYDNDGVSDFDEILTYHSNPLVSDSDNDGFSDLYETQTLHSNPNDARPGAPRLTDLEIVP